MTDAIFRPAREADLPAILALLADDPLGKNREADAGDPAYTAAFEAMAADPNQLLAVAERTGEIVGTLQLTFIPGLSRGGTWRGQIEAVRIASAHRGEGLGERFMRWAIETCQQRGCALVQLTSDRTRGEAHRFYDRLGFTASHLGYKLKL